MAEPGERHEIAARSAAEIEDRKRRITLNVLQQSRDVLADIVIARAAPKIVGAGCSAPA
jgi:hypothetical protein